MGPAIRPLLLGLALMAVVLASVPGALADEQAVETPEGTYYVSDTYEVQEPSVDPKNGDWVCILGNTCVIVPSADPGGAQASVSIWAETNGCQGLQTASQDCDGDGTDEPADEQVAQI